MKSGSHVIERHFYPMNHGVNHAQALVGSLKDLWHTVASSKKKGSEEEELL